VRNLRELCYSWQLAEQNSFARLGKRHLRRWRAQEGVAIFEHRAKSRDDQTDDPHQPKLRMMSSEQKNGIAKYMPPPRAMPKKLGTIEADRTGAENFQLRRSTLPPSQLCTFSVYSTLEEAQKEERQNLYLVALSTCPVNVCPDDSSRFRFLCICCSSYSIAC